MNVQDGTSTWEDVGTVHHAESETQYIKVFFESSHSNVCNHNHHLSLVDEDDLLLHTHQKTFPLFVLYHKYCHHQCKVNVVLLFACVNWFECIQLLQSKCATFLQFDNV